MSKAKPENHFIKAMTEVRNSGRLARIPANCWKVLYTMSLYMGADGICRPSIETLARVTGYCTRQIKKIINGRGTIKHPFISLESIGEVEVITEGNGPYPRHAYKLRPGLFRYGMNVDELQAKKNFEESHSKRTQYTGPTMEDARKVGYSDKPPGVEEPRVSIYTDTGPDGKKHMYEKVGGRVTMISS